jgi:hypothetical protein
MALKKDKQKVLGEVFDDERVKTFLEIEGREGWSSDYLRLERAYRSMKAENFDTFVKFFCEAGYDINAQNPEGKNLLQVLQDHRLSGDYCSALKASGARI